MGKASRIDWKKTPLLNRSAFAAFAAFTCLTACDNETDATRPQSVPPSAIWVGGEDGGSWFNCLQVDQLIRCQRFSRSGETYEEQDFTLCADGSLSQLGVSWQVGVYPEIAIAEGLVLVPAGPRIVYRDGEIDQELALELSREYENSDTDTCELNFIIAD